MAQGAERLELLDREMLEEEQFLAGQINAKAVEAAPDQREQPAMCQQVETAALVLRHQLQGRQSLGRAAGVVAVTIRSLALVVQEAAATGPEPARLLNLVQLILVAVAAGVEMADRAQEALAQAVQVSSYSECPTTFPLHSLRA